MVFEFGAESLYRVAGIAGVVFYLSAYALLQAGKLRGSGYAYGLLNLVAAALVLFSLSRDFNLASAIIQIAWIAISLFGLVRIFLISRGIRFNDEEEALRVDAFETMPRPLARRLLDRGLWADWEPGGELTREGETVAHLHYLRSGRAEVISDGRQVAELRGGLVGEMNVLEPGPASATVRIAEPARVFSVPGAQLRRLAASDPEMRLNLERYLNLATKRKLMEANIRLARTGERE